MIGLMLSNGARTGARVILAMLVATLVLPVGRVVAANGDGDCTANELCVFKDANYGTPRSDMLYMYDDMDGGFYFHTYNYPSSCNNIDAFSCRLNDSISSGWNGSDHRSVRLFTDAHYDGNFQKIGIYVSLTQVRYNDQTSSECWNDGGVPVGTDPDCTFSN